ncbi:MAG: DUF6046 domain-containing protein [Bacteroidales bacterium]|nr:DUF6046 domain-containing protein [Bacteroidales bacterium]
MIEFNLQNIYQEYFDEPYVTVQQDNPKRSSPYHVNSLKGYIPSTTTRGQSLFSNGIDLYGRAAFLPVRFWRSKKKIFDINCCTINVKGSKSIIRKAVAHRHGTIKEQFHIEDYVFSIKGVLIGANGRFPEKEILTLRELYETEESIELHNALTELFMPKSKRIVITNLDFPEVQGKDICHRPFTLTCESDFVDGLIVKGK